MSVNVVGNGSIEILTQSIEHLKESGTCSIQLINSALPLDKGFLDISVLMSPGTHHLRQNLAGNLWSLDWQEVSLSEMIAAVDHLGFAGTEVMGLPEFKELAGKSLYLMRNLHKDFKFAGIADDRVILVTINTDWEDLEQTRTTKH